MPYHINRDDEYSYHKFHGGQWIDYSGGLIFGYRFTKSLVYLLRVSFTNIGIVVGTISQWV